MLHDSLNNSSHCSRQFKTKTRKKTCEVVSKKAFEMKIACNLSKSGKQHLRRNSYSVSALRVLAKGDTSGKNAIFKRIRAAQNVLRCWRYLGNVQFIILMNIPTSLKCSSATTPPQIRRRLQEVAAFEAPSTSSSAANRASMEHNDGTY